MVSASIIANYPAVTRCYASCPDSLHAGRRLNKIRTLKLNVTDALR